METLRVLPGRGINDYYFLDSLVNSVLDKLRKKSTQLPCIRLVDDTKSNRIYIQVGCVSLIFDSYTQRLKVIELDLLPDKASRYKIEYEGNVYADFDELCSSLHGTFKEIQPTENCRIYTYDGLSVVVNDRTPTKLLIHLGDSLAKVWTASGEHFTSAVKIDLSSTRIQLVKDRTSHTITFGIYPEELYERLGPPSQVKHIGRAYVYSYFELGIDAVFSAETHGLERLTLHTNFPDHLLFKEYNRCLFEIRAEGTSGSVNPLSTWEAVQEFMASRRVEPKVMAKHWNFGVSATSVQVYSGVSFEVLKSGRIGSVSFCPS
mmetsp:Transcript_10639/g.20573  ORF Transcript_10639/g.20573 Transcript_10639/m.20573 type:complete len:319 (-) Transcript_10639:2917-3873(-)